MEQGSEFHSPDLPIGKFANEYASSFFVLFFYSGRLTAAIRIYRIPLSEFFHA